MNFPIKKNTIKRCIACLAAGVTIVASMPGAYALAAYVGENPDDVYTEHLLDMVKESTDYRIYLAEHVNAAYPDNKIVIEGQNCQSFEGDFNVVSDGIETPEEGSVTYRVNVPEEGMYSLLVDYVPLKGKGNYIEREFLINGELPFENAQYIRFSRVWEDAEDVVRDSRDNDVRPKQREAFCSMQSFVKDSDGYYTEPFSFYFNKGENTITLVSTRETMKIVSITLCQNTALLNYEQYLSRAFATGAQKIYTTAIKVQAENALYKSDSTLYPMADRTSPLTEPYSPSKTRLNIIGGANWKQQGQWIEWEIDVPETGLYEITFRYRQNVSTGVTVNRTLYIDGEIPFEEVSECRFYYENDWRMNTLGNGEGAYLFYLTEGRHTIKLEVSLGDDLSEIIRRADECIEELNKAYRQLLMVIGSSADTLRDYQFETKTPEALRILGEQYANILVIKSMTDEYSKGSSGSKSATIDNLVNQLANMVQKPKSIAKQWSAFKDNIVSLGSWVLSMKEQPLEIDYILIHSENEKLPKAKANFVMKLVHELRQFIASFFEDYDSIGEVYEGEPVEVWILADGAATSMSSAGRDQATVIKNLVDNYFVPKAGIGVNVKLVNSGVLLSATLAGEGPDVALNVAGKEPVNYALRHAVCDLTQFDDFDEVAGWFYKDALTQFTLGEGVYALPQTMSFHVLFYRADILKDLGLSVPRTWNEFYDALAVIQKNNMNVGITPDYTTFAMYLYQYGGKYYTDDHMASGLDSEEAIAAFKAWSGNYANYRMPVSYDFANRFRTGEMPLAIGDYTNYNYLSVFAPEIRGLWGFTLVPGYETEEGTLDHSVSAWESACILMETSEHKEDAWEFMKWWMSAETQASYGNEIENVLGVSGRVATSNLEALSNLPWAANDYKQLMAQLDYVKAIPEIPGSYYTERNIRNAFYSVYNSNADPRESLDDIVKIINDEIDSKREEFGLPTRKSGN